MLMLAAAAAAAVLWQAGSMNDMLRCQTIRGGKIGTEVRWEIDGKDRLWLSSTPRSTGKIELRCTIPVPENVGAVLELDSAAVSFVGAATRANGSGLKLTAGGLEWELLRVAGEHWIEIPGRRGTLTPTGSKIVLTLSAIDNSSQDPMRIDVRGLRLVSADTPQR
jgi:hypothetical protein